MLATGKLSALLAVLAVTVVASEVSSASMPTATEDTAAVLPYVLKNKDKHAPKSYTLLAANPPNGNDKSAESEESPASSKVLDRITYNVQPSLADKWPFIVPYREIVPRPQAAAPYYGTASPLLVVVNLSILAYVLCTVLGALNRFTAFGTQVLNNGQDIR